jgi:VanZ family protein
VSERASQSAALRRERWLALLLVLGISAVVTFAPPPNTRFNAALHDVAHVLVFAVLGFAVTRALEHAGWRATRALLAVLALGLVLGVLTESAQALLGGSLSVGDIGRDLLGSAVGFCVTQALGGPRRRAAWAGAALLGLVAGVVPFLLVLQQYSLRDARVPVLLDAGESATLYWADSDGAPVIVRNLPPALQREPGESAIEVSLQRGDYPGLTIVEPWPDWRAWRVVQFDLANPGDRQLDLGVRIDDSAHPDYADRFNARVTLAPHSRRVVEFPLEAVAASGRQRRLRLDRIDKLIVFHSGAAPGGRFYLRRIALSR